MHAMRAIAIMVVLLLVVVNALELLPAASAFQLYLSGGAIALSLVAADCDRGRARPGTGYPTCCR